MLVWPTLGKGATSGNGLQKEAGVPLGLNDWDFPLRRLAVES